MNPIARAKKIGSWITQYRPGTPRLVLLAHAGGSPSAFRPLLAHLPEDLGVLGIRYPGRQDRLGEPCPTSIDAMADEIFTALVEAPSDGSPEPVALFGHSMGALVAFAVALRFQGRGRAPVHLFVSGCSDHPAPAGAIAAGLDDQGFLAHLGQIGGTDAEVLSCSPLVRLFLPAVRADYRMYAEHRLDPKAVLGCPITALIGEADPIVDPGLMGRWAARTTGGFQLRTFPGGHFYLDDGSDDNASALGRLIASTLSPAQLDRPARTQNEPLALNPALPSERSTMSASPTRCRNQPG